MSVSCEVSEPVPLSRCSVPWLPNTLFRHRHHLVFCWLLVCQASYQEKATVKGLARLAPRHIAEGPLRRLLTAMHWIARILLWWFVDQVIEGWLHHRDSL